MKIVMIGTTYCPKCKQLAPTVEEYCSSHGIVYEYHNITDAPEDILRLLMKKNVQQAPAFIVYEGENPSLISVVLGEDIKDTLKNLTL